MKTKTKKVGWAKRGWAKKTKAWSNVHRDRSGRSMAIKRPLGGSGRRMSTGRGGQPADLQTAVKRPFSATRIVSMKEAKDTHAARWGIPKHPATYVLAHHDPDGAICFMCKPDWRGQSQLKLTSDPKKAMHWTEDSGAYKYLKRHKGKLHDFHVRWFK